MLSKRIIPCLDIKDGRTVKGVNFLDLKDAGDPVTLAKKYCDDGADELVFLDISATEENRKTRSQWVENISKTINIPFTVGGGISSISDVELLLKSGADKVALNSAVIRNPKLISDLSSIFGNQCVVVAIDAKLVQGSWKVFLVGGKESTKLNLFDWAEQAEQLGAGEILFTSMDHDGTNSGYALEALEELSNKVNIPIIASGGAGTILHFKEVFTKGHADAALAASVFHFGHIEIQQLKKELFHSGIQIRF